MPTTTQFNLANLGTYLCDKLSESDRRSICARVFGELVQIAMPKLQHYHSDLYHDAAWLNDNLDPALVAIGTNFTFFFGVDGWGTAISVDPELVKMARENVYRIVVGEGNPDTYYMWIYEIQ